MKIQSSRLDRDFFAYKKEYEEAALRVLNKGWYILGDEVASFEREWADYIGAKRCVGLASGLDALWISFRLLGIGSGDEVIVCANAYIACVMGITINGATPVFVEPDQYLNINPDLVESAITPSTKAILAVHLFGQACDMTAIMDIAQRHNLRVVEDCAQSHGNHWQGKTVGTFGDVGCFSFYPTKGCGAFGDGGAVTVNDDSLADEFRMFRNYGSRVRYENEVIGANSRLDEIQAALLRVKLRHLDALNTERICLAEKYLERLDTSVVKLPVVRPGADSVWHQFVVMSEQRNELLAFLKSRGIDALIHYPIPPHLSRAYKYLGYQEGAYPVAERQASQVISLPLYNGLTEEEQDYVIESVNLFGRQL